MEEPLALDATLEQRVQTIVSKLDATVAADRTVGVDARWRTTSSAVLPLLSIDPGPTDAAGASASGDGGADLQILGVLGAGGMGAVYAARQRALGRDVALKRPLSGTGETARAALLAEGRVMGALEHPNIVPVHALGRDADGLPVLVMKRVEGASWRDLLRDPDHPMWERLGKGSARGLGFHVDVLIAVCNALHFAHSRGMVHRDVKPDNVMVGAFGEVYLLDWGIAFARGSASSDLAGTPAYMAPEMVLDPASADERTDVYLLGATLHEVLVGRPLHDDPSLEAVLRSVLSRRPFEYPPSVPEDLAALVRVATSADRDRRPASCVEFRDALVAYVAHRASRELAASALAKLAEAEASLRSTPDALDQPGAGALLAEARFGLEQSLREWPENASAREGLDRCVRRLLERELGQKNAVAARALLAALPTPSPELEQRVVELESSLVASRALGAAAAEHARQMDATVSAWPRVLALSAFLLLGGALSVGAYLEERATGRPMPMRDQVQLDAFALAFFAVALGLGRRKLLTNAFNRRLWALWVVAILGITGVDTLFYVRGLDSWSATAIDFGVLGVVFASGALLLSPSLGWVALTALSVALISAFAPSVSTLVATLGLCISVAIVIEQSRRSAARGDAGAREDPPAGSRA